MAIFDYAPNCNPLFDFNKYLIISSTNKYGFVWVYKFPYNGGVKIDVTSSKFGYFYVLKPLIFDGDVFKETSINGVSFFRTDSTGECHKLILNLILADKYGLYDGMEKKVEIIDKIVDFSKCEECVHYSESEDSDKCSECLENPSRDYSRTPLYFEKNENLNKKKTRIKRKQ